MSRIVDMTGRQCGRLTVAERAPAKTGDPRLRWRCVCACGGEKVVLGAELRTGHVKSCGCSQERRGYFVGGARPPEYDVWQAMRGRCSRPSNKDFPHYGARGIRVCERWAKSFATFMDDMGPRPSPKHEIERTNNDLGYSPENCTWATRTEQMRNTRRSRRFLIDGALTSTRDYAKRHGIPHSTAAYRLQKATAT